MKRFVLILASVLMLSLPCFGATGDVNHADGVDLKDVIQALRVTAGIPLLSADIFTDADVNGDKKIGLEEAIYGLQVAAQLRGGSTGGDFSNSLGMTFKLVPAGMFMMGSLSTTDPNAKGYEMPQHQVNISRSFYMQTTEVTQGQWKAVMGVNPSYFSTCGDNCPVEKVSWDDVQVFITKMNQRGEGTYRLPTEAEWEYAARAGSTTAFAKGDITQPYCSPVDATLDAIGWYCGNAGSQTHPVQGKQANVYGLYDMHGNVWELVEDDWHSNYTSAPTNGSAWVNSPRGSYRVVRGGSWDFFSQTCRSANRSSSSPGYRGSSVGFRLVREP